MAFSDGGSSVRADGPGKEAGATLYYRQLVVVDIRTRYPNRMGKERNADASPAQSCSERAEQSRSRTLRRAVVRSQDSADGTRFTRKRRVA